MDNNNYFPFLNVLMKNSDRYRTEIKISNTKYTYQFHSLSICLKSTPSLIIRRFRLRKSMLL